MYAICDKVSVILSKYGHCSFEKMLVKCDFRLRQHPCFVFKFFYD